MKISKAFETRFQNYVLTVFSYFDVPNDERKTAESFYHAFTLGMLMYLKDDYYIHSNGEPGYGRYDACLEAKDKNKPSFILEFKLKRFDGLSQINDKKYDTVLLEKGIINIHKLEFVFSGKNVDIKENI